MNRATGIILWILMLVTLLTLITIYIVRFINHKKQHETENEDYKKLYNKIHNRQMRQHDRLNKISLDVLDFAKHQVAQKKRLDGINTMVVENESDIDGLEDNMVRNQSSLGNLKTQVSGLNLTVKSNTDKHVQHTQRLSDVSDLAHTTNRVAMDNRDTIQGFNINSMKKMNALEEQMELINESINTNTENIADLQMVQDED